MDALVSQPCSKELIFFSVVPTYTKTEYLINLRMRISLYVTFTLCLFFIVFSNIFEVSSKVIPISNFDNYLPT